MFGEQQRFMLFLIAPAASLMLLFQVLPIVIGANASFRDWALYNPKKIWVGFSHYYAVLSDPAFLYVVLPNTFIFMIVSVLGRLSSRASASPVTNAPSTLTIMKMKVLGSTTSRKAGSVMTAR